MELVARSQQILEILDERSAADAVAAAARVSVGLAVGGSRNPTKCSSLAASGSKKTIKERLPRSSAGSLFPSLVCRLAGWRVASFAAVF